MSDARVNAGRVAVVTGAARGIGQAIALRLAEAGHRLALDDMRPAGETESR
jgi:NAD(P)-dependent dehydrogenase (short-subunit alcohol dehydrogenase family)